MTMVEMTGQEFKEAIGILGALFPHVCSFLPASGPSPAFSFPPAPQLLIPTQNPSLPSSL
jgi:hypothetical protein